jgi:hypothetical protein
MIKLIPFLLNFMGKICLDFEEIIKFELSVVMREIFQFSGDLDEENLLSWF